MHDESSDGTVHWSQQAGHLSNFYVESITDWNLWSVGPSNPGWVSWIGCFYLFIIIHSWHSAAPRSVQSGFVDSSQTWSIVLIQDKHLQSRFGYRCLKYHPLISSFIWVTFFLLAQTKSDVQLPFFGMPKYAHPFTVWLNCLDFNFSFLHARFWIYLVFETCTLSSFANSSRQYHLMHISKLIRSMKWLNWVRTWPTNQSSG